VSWGWRANTWKGGEGEALFTILRDRLNSRRCG
jgi:hypothetical protein